MSLSNQNSGSQFTGKVVMGMHTPGPDEMTLQEIEGKRRLMWDDSTDAEYLERVKRKAKEKAKEIMLMAELEAEALRATASHEGYAEGIAKAQEELDQHTEALSTQVNNMLAQIGSQGANIYSERQDDIIALIKLAVEKTLKVELSESRVDSLKALTREALERIESQRQLTLKCHPQDVEDLEGFLAAIQERNPALKYWTVKGDQSVDPGGILVEGADGKVDNTVASRWQGVEPILDQLAKQLTASEG